MNDTFKRALIFAAALLIGIVTGGGWAWATPPAGQICEGLDSGKVDVSGDVGSVTVTAPDGYLIDQYCVKAGSAQQGNGAEYVDVVPPAESVTITHSSGKDVSHYSVSYTEKTTPTPTPTETEPTPTPTETEPTPTPTETEPTPTETEPTPTDEPSKSPPPGDKPNPPNEDKPERTPDSLPKTGAALELLAVAGGAIALGSTLYLLGRRRSGI